MNDQQIINKYDSILGVLFYPNSYEMDEKENCVTEGGQLKYRTAQLTSNSLIRGPPYPT